MYSSTLHRQCRHVCLAIHPSPRPFSRTKRHHPYDRCSVRDRAQWQANRPGVLRGYAGFRTLPSPDRIWLFVTCARLPSKASYWKHDLLSVFQNDLIFVSDTKALPQQASYWKIWLAFGITNDVFVWIPKASVNITARVSVKMSRFEDDFWFQYSKTVE